MILKQVSKFLGKAKGILESGILSSVMAASLLASEQGMACDHLQATGTNPNDVYQALMFPQDFSIISECLALASEGKANSTVQTALSTYFIQNPDAAALEPNRTQIETWLRQTNEIGVIDNFALGFGLACQPSSCALREPQFSTIKTKLLAQATEKDWLQMRLTSLLSNGIGFDTVLTANLSSSNAFEKILIDAFKFHAVGHFTENVSPENAKRFQWWLNSMVQSAQIKYDAIKEKSSLAYSELLPLMYDLTVIKAATDQAVFAAKKKQLVILRNDKFAPSQDNLGTGWKNIIDQVYPIYWDIVQKLNDKKIANDLGSDNGAFDALFVSLMLNDSTIAKTPAQALSYLAFDRYPSNPGSKRLKLYMDEWSDAVAKSLCASNASNCEQSNSDLLVIASRKDKINSRAEDLINIKGSLVSRDSSGYLNSYENLLDTLEATDPFYCGKSEHPLSVPCITLGYLLKKPLQPLFVAVKDRYQTLSTNQQPGSVAPINLLQLINNYETAHAVAFEENIGRTDESFTQKFISVALEKKVAITEEYKQDGWLLNENGHLHQAVCKRISIEPQWFPVKSMETDPRRLEWMARNVYALNRLASLHSLYDEHGPLNRDVSSQQYILTSEFFNRMSSPVLTPDTCQSEVDWVDMNDAYMQVMAKVQDYLYSDFSFMDRDLQDTFYRFDHTKDGGIQ